MSAAQMGAMAVRLNRQAAEGIGSVQASSEKWPYLDEGVTSIPGLTCQLNHGLIAHGEHLASRCQAWSDDMVLRESLAQTKISQP
jgi:hypothetical protein